MSAWYGTVAIPPCNLVHCSDMLSAIVELPIRAVENHLRRRGTEISKDLTAVDELTVRQSSSAYAEAGFLVIPENERRGPRSAAVFTNLRGVEPKWTPS